MASTTSDVPRQRKRTPSLGVAVGLMTVLTAAGALFAASALWQLITGRFLVALGGASPYLTLEALPQLLSASPRDGASIRIVDLDLWVRALAWTPTVIGGLTLAAAALLTLRLLSRVRTGAFFAAGTIRTVRAVGLVLASGGLLEGALDTAASWVFSTTQTGNASGGWHEAYVGLGFTGGSWPAAMIVVGVVVLALGAVFREGAHLEEEAAGVI